jgi:hypothetical protein
MAMAAIGLAAGGCAHAGQDPVDLKVVDRETGRALRIWRHDGRLFVAGQPGARYSLRVINHTDGRVLVVMSVDGVNILTGESANYDQRGYVFDAHQSYDVTGWRKSTTEVAAFTFAPLPQSYAARTGRPADVGVIGMAVFDEQVPAPVESYIPPSAPPDLRGESDRAASRADDSAAGRPMPPPPPAAALTSPRMEAPSPAQSSVVVTAERRDDKLGTAHGAREWSVSTVVPFERATTHPQFVRQIEYDTHDNLVARGVIPSWDKEHRLRPFPSNSDEEGYVPDPPGGP